MPAALSGRRSSGFGLLEAIVALTLLSASGLALFAWLNTNLETASRLRDRDQSARLQLAALELMAGVNAMDEPEGKRTAGGMQLSWKAEPLGDAAIGAGFTGPGMGQFRLQLFDTRVEARDERTGASARFVLTQVGYHRLRPGGYGDL